MGPFLGAPGLLPLFSNSPTPATYPHIFPTFRLFFTSFFMALKLMMISEPPDDRGHSPCLSSNLTTYYLKSNSTLLFVQLMALE